MYLLHGGQLSVECGACPGEYVGPCYLLFANRCIKYINMAFMFENHSLNY